MIVILMVVSGVDKTTIGHLLSGKLGCLLFHADDFHPEASIA